MSKLMEQIDNLKENVEELEERLKILTNDENYYFQQRNEMLDELKAFHNLKNKKGEIVLGQMYPPGLVGFKCLVQSNDFYMDAGKKIEALKKWGGQMIFKISSSTEIDHLIEQGLLIQEKNGSVQMNVDYN